MDYLKQQDNFGKVCGYHEKEPFGFTVSPADPCMLFKESNLGICIIIMYVDDMLIIGKRAQIQEFATMIQKEFSVRSSTTWRTT